MKPASARRTRETNEIPAIDRATALAARAALEAFGAVITRSFRYTSSVAATIPPQLAPALRRLPVVDYVEASFAGRPQAVTGQDTAWGVKKVNAHYVWMGWYGPTTRGENVYVTMLDAGVDSIHRWFGDGPENLFVDCYWIDGSGPSGCYQDGNPHGAHVAGIVASRNDQAGYIGVAHNLQGFASIRVCNANDGCLPEWVAAGLDWVLASGRPRHIVNISIGYCRNYQAISQLVSTLASAGVLIIASAGNSVQGINLCPEGANHQLGSEWETGVMWPARYDQVMAVSGTLENDQFATPPPPSGGGGGGGLPDTTCTENCEPTLVSGTMTCPVGSRSGPQVDVAAPFWAPSMWGGGTYRNLCGTSMSAPLVSAVAALVWSLNPTLTATQVWNRLTSTADALFPATQFGAGRVNAVSAVYVQPPTYSASITGPTEVQPYATCSFAASTTSPDAPYSYEWFADGVTTGFTGWYYYHTAGPSAFTLSVTIVDAQGRHLYASHEVTVSSTAPECLDQ